MARCTESFRSPRIGISRKNAVDLATLTLGAWEWVGNRQRYTIYGRFGTRVSDGIHFLRGAGAGDVVRNV